MNNDEPKEKSIKKVERDFSKEIGDQLDYIQNKDKKIKVRLATFLQEKVDPFNPHSDTKLEKFLKKVYSKAVDDGDVNAMRLIWSYSDGLPRQEIVMEDNSEKPRFVIGKVEINKEKKEEKIVDGEVVKDD